MKIIEILKSVGGGILKNAFPPLSGMAFDAINAALPADKKLEKDATGEDAHNAAINYLPETTRANLLEKKLEVEITEIKEWTARFAAMNEADATGATARPYAVKAFTLVTCFAIISFISFVNIAIYNEAWKTLEKLQECWQLIAVILGIPSMVLNSYFGKRNKEKEKRYEMMGAPQSVGWLKSIISAMKGK